MTEHMEPPNVDDLSREEMENALRTCDELLLVADAQSAAIADGDSDRLNELLNRREELAAGLHFEKWGLGRTAKGVSRAQPERAVLVEKLKELSRIDDVNRNALEALLTKMRAQLVQLDQGRHAIGQYVQRTPPPDPMFIDRRR